MQASQVRLICAMLPIAFLVVIWFAFEPRGSWSMAYLLMALIASGGIWSVFYGFGATRALGGAIGVMFLVGSLGVAAKGSFNQEAYDHLGELVKTYNKDVEYVEELKNHRGLRSGQTIWNVKIAASKSKIRNHYLNSDNTPGWELVSDEDPLVFRSEQGRLTVRLDGSGGITRLRFDYQKE